MGDPIPGSAEYDTEKGFKEKGKDTNSKSGIERMQIQEEDVRTEIVDVLSGTVANAIMRYIAEIGACSRKDLETLDAVVKEGESVVRGLREYGLIAVEKDTVVITEKGRKVLEFIDGLDRKLRGR